MPYNSSQSYGSFSGYRSSIGFSQVGPELDRDWLIGQSSFLYGFESLNYGALNPDGWVTPPQTIQTLTVDSSIDEMTLKASDNSQWSGLNTVTIKTQGTTDIVLTWDGISSYKLIDAVYTAYIVSQLGNTIKVGVFPKLSAGEAYSDAYSDAYA